MFQRKGLAEHLCTQERAASLIILLVLTLTTHSFAEVPVLLITFGVVCAIIMITMILRGSDIFAFERPEDTVLSPVGRFWALVSNPGFLVLFGYTLLSCALLMVAA